MPLNIKDRLRKLTPFIDRPNSFKENIGENIALIIMILLTGALLYLFITGLPTIQIVLETFIQSIAEILP